MADGGKMAKGGQVDYSYFKDKIYNTYRSVSKGFMSIGEEEKKLEKLEQEFREDIKERNKGKSQRELEIIFHQICSKYDLDFDAILSEFGDEEFAKGGETKFINLKTLKGQSEVEKYLAKGWSIKYQGDKFAILQKGGKKMVKGGATFDDKVNAISKNLKGRKVPKKLQKDYGKTYDTKKERDDAARRIAGAMRADEMGTRKK
jgi:hypothetical protein